VPLVGLPQSGDRTWGPAYHLWLAPEVPAGGTSLLIGNAVGPLEPWGVRIDRILPDSSALGEGLPGQATTAQRQAGASLLVPARETPAELDLRFFDVDGPDELAIRIEGVAIGYADLTGNQAWGTSQTFALPPGLPAVLTIDPSRNAPPGDAWGVRIEGWR
jgi:hypothetical protein